MNHSRWQRLVDDGASTNERESLWSEMKRGIRSLFRKIGPKRAQRHVDEFTGGLNVRDRDTIVHRAALTRGMGSRHLPCRRLIADNGRKSHERETAAKAASCGRWLARPDEIGDPRRAYDASHDYPLPLLQGLNVILDVFHTILHRVELTSHQSKDVPRGFFNLVCLLRLHGSVSFAAAFFPCIRVVPKCTPANRATTP